MPAYGWYTLTNTSKMHLAQLNVARMLGPIDGEIMRPFVELLAPVNEIAEASAGFIWRDKTAAGDNTEVKINDDPMLIVNFSIWESPADLGERLRAATESAKRDAGHLCEDSDFLCRLACPKGASKNPPSRKKKGLAIFLELPLTRPCARERRRAPGPVAVSALP